MRQIILDTETTGLGHELGHKIIEIGCIELVDRKVTGNHYHIYLNPQRAVDEGAFRVHGISNDFLADKPIFADVIHDFIQFIDNSELIIHNAPFDVGFLNAEFLCINWAKKLEEHCNIFDTLTFAREKHPGQRNNLDALCKRYEIDNANRKFHGALLDAEILANVYLAMTGGQTSLFTEDLSEAKKEDNIIVSICESINTPIIAANAEELARHQEFVQSLVKKSGKDYWNIEHED
jgi:DNA polymerase-3 subunit epsilon